VGAAVELDLFRWVQIALAVLTVPLLLLGRLQQIKDTEVLLEGVHVAIVKVCFVEGALLIQELTGQLLRALLAHCVPALQDQGNSSIFVVSIEANIASEDILHSLFLFPPLQLFGSVHCIALLLHFDGPEHIGVELRFEYGLTLETVELLDLLLDLLLPLLLSSLSSHDLLLLLLQPINVFLSFLYHVNFLPKLRHLVFTPLLFSCLQFLLLFIGSNDSLLFLEAASGS